MGTEFLGRDVKESVAEADSIGDGTVSAWDTNKRKEMGLTHGPGRSAAEETCGRGLLLGARLGRGDLASAQAEKSVGRRWSGPSGALRGERDAGRRGEEVGRGQQQAYGPEEEEERIFFSFSNFFPKQF